MSSPGVTSSAPSRRQKRMGPAPFASFEDLSDEVRSRLESPEEKASGSVVRLPGIREDTTPNTPAPNEEPQTKFLYTGISLVGDAATMAQPSTKSTLQAPSTPRIDISRASSSSHHDSKDSSPERELFDGPDPSAGAKLGLGFREEGTLDLRSSTEELDFQDPALKNKPRTRPQSPCLQDESVLGHGRKDSQSSDIVLLSISGRTSRLSSIGSQGSAQSRLSNASHLSVVSGQSGLSRSPSPHKVLLETSFCGPKPTKSGQVGSELQDGTKVDDSEELELVLLSRKHDPTEAILAEGISMELKATKHQQNNVPTKESTTKQEQNIQSVKSDILITVDKPTTSDSNNVVPNLPQTYVSKSGVEYTYIPLKGPLPKPSPATTRSKPREVKSALSHLSTDKSSLKTKSKSATPSPVTSKSDAIPKYIRIKLKPDHMYDDEEPQSGNADFQKPYSLNLTDASKKPPQSFAEIMQNETISVSATLTEPSPRGKSLSSTPNASPKLSRRTFLKECGSKTPSPSLSRKSSFCSLFKSKDTIISPESPTVSGSRRKHTITGILRDASESLRDRSRSKSKDRDKSSIASGAPSSSESIDSNKAKQKSVFSIFKPKKGDKKSDVESSPEILPTLEGLANVEFKFKSDEHAKERRTKYHEAPLEGDSIRIPLHSPTYSEKSMLQDVKTSSMDSQETVIEVTSRNVNAIIEPVPKFSESNTPPLAQPKMQDTNRQSSTSSENIVFSTKLGSNNEIFTTKLPKSNLKMIVDKPEEPESTPKESSEPKPDSCHHRTPQCHVCIKSEETTTPPLKDMTTTENRNSINSSVADDNSSESERDSEIEFKSRKERKVVTGNAIEHEGLVLQQDSFDDELPYVPTTLPLERSVAIPIVPVKQRSTFEMKTCPIERPRSTTPINPSCLEDYCEEVVTAVDVNAIEKLKISLPKDDSGDRHGKVKSPHKTGGKNTNWFAFAEMKISPQRRSSQEETTPPPLPPKGVQKEWINFEEIPERRKPPKRIQTIPSRGNIDVPESLLQENVVYSYVNPEDCKCECHEISARQKQAKPEPVQIQEDEMPLLEDDPGDEEKLAPVERIKLDVAISERRNVISDSSARLSTTNGTELLLRTPFTSDLGVSSSSNRSSIISQEEPSSPDFGTPNAFSKS